LGDQQEIWRHFEESWSVCTGIWSFFVADVGSYRVSIWLELRGICVEGHLFVKFDCVCVRKDHGELKVSYIFEIFT
jgi:hypothetical protein